jgi:hypothetical protein
MGNCMNSKCIGGASANSPLIVGDVEAADRPSIDDLAQRSSLRSMQGQAGRGESVKEPPASSRSLILRKTDDVKGKYFIDEAHELGSGQVSKDHLNTCARAQRECSPPSPRPSPSPSPLEAHRSLAEGLCFSFGRFPMLPNPPNPLNNLDGFCACSLAPSASRRARPRAPDTL